MRIWKEEVRDGFGVLLQRHLGGRCGCLPAASPPLCALHFGLCAAIAHSPRLSPSHAHLSPPAPTQIFGPVLAARTFASEAEAIQLANASEFGLGAGVISADEARCK